MGGCSAHADRDESLAWHRATGNPGRTILVHGEEEAMRAFASELKRIEVVMPKLSDTLEL